MSETIYYFSSTGSSLPTELDIAEDIGGTEVTSIAKVGKNAKSGSAVVGYIFPAYADGMPYGA